MLTKLSNSKLRLIYRQNLQRITQTKRKYNVNPREVGINISGQVWDACGQVWKEQQTRKKEEMTRTMRGILAECKQFTDAGRCFYLHASPPNQITPALQLQLLPITSGGLSMSVDKCGVHVDKFGRSNKQERKKK